MPVPKKSFLQNHKTCTDACQTRNLPPARFLKRATERRQQTGNNTEKLRLETTCPFGQMSYLSALSSRSRGFELRSMQKKRPGCSRPPIPRNLIDKFAICPTRQPKKKKTRPSIPKTTNNPTILRFLSIAFVELGRLFSVFWLMGRFTFFLCPAADT